MTTEQKDAIKKAGEILNEAFPNKGMQICFNLSREHNNVNYNVKESGIIKK